MSESVFDHSILDWVSRSLGNINPATDVSHEVPDKSNLASWLTDGHGKSNDLLESFARSNAIPWDKNGDDFVVFQDFAVNFPVELARKFNFVVGEGNDGSLSFNAGNLAALCQVDHVRRLFRKPVQIRLRPAGVVDSLIEQSYQQRKSITHSTIGQLEEVSSLQDMQIVAGGEDLLDTSGKSPIIQLTNSIVFDAISIGASDIHIQPYEHHLQVRFRIDGVLFDQFQIPKENQEEILSRVKVMGQMNIAEKRLPQDGRASVSLGNRAIDLRIASLPTSHGERVVIRLLDKGAKLYSLEELGMSAQILKKFRRLIQQEHGLFLVTGPTGGGKSTTLYAALQEIDVVDKNVLTLEDPIEYRLDGISQTQVNEKKGLTFAKGLRNILRQDPDIIMIGEIRDQATAEMAIQSALTGHMVFSTLHTNDAASAVTRLLDLGIEPFLVASSVVGVLAQRLVRKICPSCKNPVAGRTNDLGCDASFIGAGCQACRDTGYAGRIGVFELMLVDEAVQGLIQGQVNAADIRQTATQNGMKLLQQDGIDKINSGLTTVDEVLRVSAKLEEQN